MLALGTVPIIPAGQPDCTIAPEAFSQDVKDHINRSTSRIVYPLSHATAFFISEDGYMLTNYHVVDRGGPFTVYIDGVKHRAVLKDVAPQYDLALLKVVDVRVKHYVKISQCDVKLGDAVGIIGYPRGKWGQSYGKLESVVKSYNPSGSHKTCCENGWRMTAMLNPGASGSAIFNTKGELVAVYHAKTPNRGLAIPLDHVKEFLDGRVGSCPETISIITYLFN